jgi:hypothetical protein
MRVISLKSNTKLIKGHEYIADSFNNTTNGTGWVSFIIKIRGFGSYQCKNFSDINGNPLPQVRYRNPNIPRTEQFDCRTLQINDIIVCKSNRYKYLIKDGKYRISEVNIISNYHAIISNYHALMKIEGYNKWIGWNSHNFRKLSLQESRDLALSQIFDQPENFSVDFIRKFDKEKNQTKILLETIAKSIIDKNRHYLDVIDWGIHKEKYQELKREDFSELLQKPLAEILELYENSLKN